jgi:hypothetical protein
MNQYLIAVTVSGRIDPEQRERYIYRVPVNASLKDVIETAKLRCEIVGPLTCTGLEVLGELEPHLWEVHPNLFDSRDLTDQPLPGEEENAPGAVCQVERGVHRVMWHGRLCSPEWTEAGPARAYLLMLRRGQRQPEYVAAV